MGRTISEITRRAVAERAVFCCEYCRAQERYSPDDFVIDHILPRRRQGSNLLVNLALACFTCNGHKQAATEALDPKTQQHVPLFNPRRDIWSHHFTWESDFEQIIGTTPTGRATVVRMHLNRDGLVNLRQVLRKLGLHPLEVW